MIILESARFARRAEAHLAAPEHLKCCYHILYDCYHRGVKQLITRVDDGLHARLKARAAAEGRSLNDLVSEVLAAAVGRPLTRKLVRARAKAAGLLAEPPIPERTVAREEALEVTRGLGAAASAALDADRAAR